MKLFLSLFLVSLIAGLAGCSKKAEVETEKPIAEVREEAKTMSLDDLETTVLQYQDALADTMEDMVPLKEKLSAIPLTEQMGEDAKALQQQIADISEQIGAIEQRLQIYGDSLQAKMVEATPAE